MLAMKRTSTSSWWGASLGRFKPLQLAVLACSVLPLLRLPLFPDAMDCTAGPVLQGSWNRGGSSMVGGAKAGQSCRHWHQAPAHAHHLPPQAAIWNRLSERDENWRLCYKALLLCEFLIKQGPMVREEPA